MAGHDDVETVLRGLARLLAPYLREELDGPQPAIGSSKPEAGVFNGHRASEFASGLGQELTHHALVLFEALRKPPQRIDARALADRLGVASGREVSGLLITPLKRHLRRHGFPADPWDELSEGSGQRVFIDRDGNAQRVHLALLQHQRQHHWTPTVEELLAHPELRRPVPTSLYVWAPEYADFSSRDDGTETLASCLATDRPGTRAAIYRAHDAQGVVALFDVGEEPEPDRDWGYSAHGRLHVLKNPVTRKELLEVPELARIFAHIQGRRRIPPPARDPIKQLLVTRFPASGKTPDLPVFLPLKSQRTKRRTRS